MAKEEIFSKINLKDYNSILEDILEKKDFSEDVKNLLLSMLYKIENSYNDYEQTKVDAITKRQFIKMVVNIINQCKKIEIIKPMSEESKVLNNKNYIIDKENKTIKLYPNEKILLEAIIEIGQKDIELDEKYSFLSISIKEILKIGNYMQYGEIIRDFNGWSWDITTSQIENKNINIVYQNLLILLGNKYLNELINGKEINEDQEENEIPNNEILRSKYNENFGMTAEEMQEDKSDYIQIIENNLIKYYGTEKSKKLKEQIIKTILAIGVNINQEQRKIVIEEKEKIKSKLLKMKDNKIFLNEVSEQKKEIRNKIKQIDTLLNDEEKLKKEYNKRNEKLPNKEKIFSVSHLVIMLEKEREKNLEEIQKINKSIEPKEFVNIKNDLEYRLEFLNDIGEIENKKADENKQIENLQKIFLQCFEEKIKKAETKKEITELIYQLRYYELFPYKDITINKIEKIQYDIEEIEKKLISKACEQKILITIAKVNLNYIILKNIFITKIIDLEKINIILKYNRGILKIEIYDTNILENVVETKITEKTELQVKLNKKIKICLF